MINENPLNYAEDQKQINWKSSVVIDDRDRKFIDRQCQKYGTQHYGSVAFTQEKLRNLTNQVVKALINQDIWSLDQSLKEDKIIGQVKYQIKYRYDSDSEDQPYITNENLSFSKLSKRKKQQRVARLWQVAFKRASAAA